MYAYSDDKRMDHFVYTHLTSQSDERDAMRRDVSRTMFSDQRYAMTCTVLHSPTNIAPHRIAPHRVSLIET